jgi:diguanylate cyclase
LIPGYVSLGCSIVCACIGFIIGLKMRRQISDASSKSAFSTSAEQHLVDSGKQMDAMISSLHDLTSQVDSQVGEHSLRVGEITTNLENPGGAAPEMLLYAGKLLVSANQKLQADLKEAKCEIERQREQMSSSLRDSRTDALTNLPNRRAFDHELARAFTDRRRDGSPFSLVIIDIDHFKRVNDQHGHMVGDQMLKHFARCLSEGFRDADLVARFGGEEFAAILPRTSLEESVRVADLVRRAVSGSPCRVGNSELSLTASFGVKQVGADEIDTELIQRADNALYAAKKGGRNRVCFHDGVTTRYCDSEVADEQ